MATLLLRLAAPLQSWGTDSKFEIRKTDRQPSKSGVLGLVAAALGYRRDDDAAIQSLHALRFGVRVDREGQQLLNDLHNAHAEKFWTTGDAKTYAYITHRYYLADAIFLAGLESEDEALLQQIADALQHPAYPLFLGRRSCPPTLPLCLGIRQNTLEEALQAEPWLVTHSIQQDDNQQVRMQIEPKEITATDAVIQDKPISFSPLHRDYGYRPVREQLIRLDKMSDEQTLQNAETDHDPFSELSES